MVIHFVILGTSWWHPAAAQLSHLPHRLPVSSLACVKPWLQTKLFLANINARLLPDMESIFVPAIQFAPQVVSTHHYNNGWSHHFCWSGCFAWFLQAQLQYSCSRVGSTALQQPLYQKADTSACASIRISSRVCVHVCVCACCSIALLGIVKIVQLPGLLIWLCTAPAHQIMMSTATKSSLCLRFYSSAVLLLSCEFPSSTDRPRCVPTTLWGWVHVQHMAYPVDTPLAYNMSWQAVEHNVVHCMAAMALTCQSICNSDVANDWE